MASIKFTKAIEEKRFFSCFTVIMTLKHEKNIHFNNEVITQQCWPNGYNIFQQCRRDNFIVDDLRSHDMLLEH